MTDTTTYRYAIELEDGSEVVADSWPEMLAALVGAGFTDAARELGTATPEGWVTFDAEWSDDSGVWHSVYVEGVGPDYQSPEQIAASRDGFVSYVMRAGKVSRIDAETWYDHADDAARRDAVKRARLDIFHAARRAD